MLSVHYHWLQPLTKIDRFVGVLNLVFQIHCCEFEGVVHLSDKTLDIKTVDVAHYKS